MVLFCVYWSLVVEDVDGVGDKWLGDTTTFVEQTLLEDYFNTFLQSACLTDMECLLIKSKASCLRLSQVPDYQNFRIIGHKIKEYFF
jgi:hypothetical protein